MNFSAGTGRQLRVSARAIPEGILRTSGVKQSDAVKVFLTKYAQLGGWHARSRQGAW